MQCISMGSSTWVVVLMSFTLGCTDPGSTARANRDPASDATDDDDLSLLQPVADVELTIDSEPVVSAVATLHEFEGADTPTCTGGVALHSDAWSGIAVPPFVFANRATGTASSMGLNTVLYWNESDPDASGEDMDWQWAGTVAVVTWTDDLIELDLLDGERCAWRATSGCTPSTGRLLLRGLRTGPDAGQSERSWFTDVASGDPLCNSPLN